MPVYELMRKDQRVTVLAVNKTGGIEKCDYKNINQEIAPLQERICSDWIERWWNKRAVPLNQGKIREILEQHGILHTDNVFILVRIRQFFRINIVQT